MIEIKTYAPVLIPTLNRYEHLKRCVESLSRCTHADKTELVIGLDYPPSEKYVAGWKKVCEYVSTITGFGKVTIFRREENLGATLNNRDLRKYASQYYDRYINVEDDNEVSPNFLDYINKGLEKYKDDPRVFGVCAYKFREIDLSDYEDDYFFAHEVNTCGWGRWFSDKCENVIKAVHKPGYLTNIIKDTPFHEFLRDDTKPCNILNLIGLEFRGDGYYTCYEWKNDVYCVFPKVSMVRIHGLDGSGIHGGTYLQEEYANQPIDDRLLFDNSFEKPVEMDRFIRAKFKKYQSGNIKQKIKKILLLILMKCFVRVRGY